MWIRKKKWNALEKRIADLERKVQSQQDFLKTALAPPVNHFVGGSGYTSRNGYDCCGNTSSHGGGGINYDRLTVEALVDINNSIATIGALIKDSPIPRDIKTQ